ncbi:MAG: hypothetical protein IAI48_00340 [Candidatus Eremiobacteraeota bacterium]|nr:hypothetical protein [Candidatus Eremiobacteraeota bacterium]
MSRGKRGAEFASTAHAAFGVTVDETDGQLPPDDGIPKSTAAPESDPVVSEEIAKLRDPAVQFKYIHEEARDGGRPELVALEMRSEVYIVEWEDRNGHRYRQDDRPDRCPLAECRSSEFTMHERLEDRTVRLPLKFSQIEIHRKKIYEHIEHFALIVRAEMQCRHPEPIMTAKWLSEHRGYVEVGLTAAPTKMVIREICLILGIGDGETIEGLTDASLTAAGLALLGLRTERSDRMAEAAAKKAPGPSTTASSVAPGSPAFTSSS